MPDPIFHKIKKCLEQNSLSLFRKCILSVNLQCSDLFLQTSYSHYMQTFNSGLLILDEQNGSSDCHAHENLYIPKTEIILTDKTIFLQIHVISTNLDIPEPFHRICCLAQNDPMGIMSLHGNIYSFKLHQLDLVAGIPKSKASSFTRSTRLNWLYFRLIT